MEELVFQRESLQDVNNNFMKIYSLLTLTILLFSITGCASKRVDAGTYSINKKQAQPGAVNPIVYGYVFEHGTKLPVIAPRLVVGKKLTVRPDPKSGQYSFSIEPGKYRFVGWGLGYYPTKTRKTKVSKGDSVRIDFYLKVHTTLLRSN